MRRLHYVSETAPGSSGPPVFNDRWELVAIHHRSHDFRDPATARLENRKIGTPIDVIIAALEARGVWPPKSAFLSPKPKIDTGAMDAGSSWYVSRTCDQAVLQAMEGEAATLFIVGARHSGKSSLAKRHAFMQEALGWTQVWFDAETDFTATDLASVEKVLDRIVQKIARKFPRRISSELESARGTPSFLKDFLAETFPNGSKDKVALFIDRADTFLGTPCADDLFLGLRSVNDANLHTNVRVVLTYSRNMKQNTQSGSVFSAAAEVVSVDDFTQEELAALHSRFAEPLFDPHRLRRQNCSPMASLQRRSAGLPLKHADAVRFASFTSVDRFLLTATDDRLIWWESYLDDSCQLIGVVWTRGARWIGDPGLVNSDVGQLKILEPWNPGLIIVRTLKRGLPEADLPKLLETPADLLEKYLSRFALKFEDRRSPRLVPLHPIATP